MAFLKYKWNKLKMNYRAYYGVEFIRTFPLTEDKEWMSKWEIIKEVKYQEKSHEEVKPELMISKCPQSCFVTVVANFHFSHCRVDNESWAAIHDIPCIFVLAIHELYQRQDHESTDWYSIELLAKILWLLSEEYHTLVDNGCWK